MHRAAALLSVVCVMAPAFAGESLSMREYEERCASYYAQEYGVSPALVRAIIQIESAWQPGVVSSKGAMGLMQLMPATAQHFGVTHPFYIHENVVAESRTWRSFRHSFMATFAWLWPRMRQARSRFSRGDWTTPRKKSTHTFNGLRNSIAPS